MALYNSKGKISEMSPVKSGVSKNGYEWKRMSVVLEIPGFQGSITKQIFQVSGDLVDEVSQYKVGDWVDLAWTMYAREWDGKIWNNVELCRIRLQSDPDTPPTQPAPPVAREPEPVEADLPF